MRAITLLITAATVAAVLVGCAGRSAVSPSWARVRPDDHRQYQSKLGFTADLPVNWMKVEDETSLVLTRHSVPMDVIRVMRHRLPAALPGTELTVNPNMQFYELAEVVINGIRATPGVFDLVIEEVAPHRIDGRDGFRVIGAYRLDNGMVRRCLVHGFIHGDSYTEIGLYALDEYYFNAVVDDFIAMVGSIKVD